MVEIHARAAYPEGVPNLQSIADGAVERGRRQAVADGAAEPAGSLAALHYADLLRRSAERLCQSSAESARHAGASWREIGEAVGGITPQGAEHRFSPAAKERRSKASKVEWASKERRKA